MNINKQLLKEALELVNDWDFSLTKRKLQEKQYGGWSKERAERAEVNYKRYLALVKATDGYQFVPNEDIDQFWHEHILDTRRYCADCFTLFGGFLHHYPFFSMNGESDYENWIQASNLSNEKWAEIFGEDLYDHCDYSVPVYAQKCPQRCPGKDLKAIDKFYYGSESFR